MCGALLCTGFTDELADMFEPDREILVYRNQYELLDKVRFYLNHPAEAEIIRKAGRARALADHTYQNRFKTLFAQLKLPH
jgi:spore maturation protein CgeB